MLIAVAVIALVAGIGWRLAAADASRSESIIASAVASKATNQR